MIENAPQGNTYILKYLCQHRRRMTLATAWLRWSSAPCTCTFEITETNYSFKVELFHQGFMVDELVHEYEVAEDSEKKLLLELSSVAQQPEQPKSKRDEKTPLLIEQGASIHAFKPSIKVFKA